MTARDLSAADTAPLPRGDLPRDDVLPRALRYEWAALRSVRAPWLLCGSAIAVQILADIAVGRGRTAGSEQLAMGMQGLTLAGFAFFAALGVTVIGTEYRYRTITTTVLTLRDRRGIGLAKAALTAAVTAAAAAVMVAINALSVPVLGGTPVSPERVAALGAAGVGYAVLCALAGLALGGITRNSALSIAVAILWPAILEKIVILTLHVSRNLVPFTAAAAQAEAPGGAGPRWVLMLPLAALTAVLLAAAGALFCRRDV